MDYFVSLLASLLSIMLVITLHEFAHAFVSYKCGDPTAKFAGRMTLNPVKHFDLLGVAMFAVAGFGWAKPVPVNPYNFKNQKSGALWTSAAGVVCRASAGASELIDTYSGELTEMIAHLKTCGYRFAVADADAPQTVYDADLTYPLVLAVGGEKRGFSKNIEELSDITVSLPYGRDFPMALSAASAATVLAFEASRQNRK